MSQEIKDFCDDESLKIIRNLKNWRDCSPDNPPCAKCKKIITGMPIMFFQTKMNKEIAFHINCISDKIKVFNDNEAILDANEYIIVGCNFCKERNECNHVDQEDLKKYGVEKNEKKNID